MRPIAEIQQVRPGLLFWEGYEPAVKTDCSSCALVVEGKVMFVDPLPLTPGAMGEVLEHGQALGVVLTSGNHERAAAAIAGSLGLPIYAHPEALPDPADARPFPVAGMEIVELPGAGPGEIALVCGGVLVIGDALINLEPQGLAVLPDKYCADPRRLRISLQKLRDVPFEVVTFAHGRPMVSSARERVVRLLDSLS